jgi:hypothetical protein
MLQHHSLHIYCGEQKERHNQNHNYMKDQCQKQIVGCK